MKHFNFKPDAQLLKLSLVGAMIAALGASMSFNPETKTIARNEAQVIGSTSLASTNSKLPSCSVDMTDLSQISACDFEFQTQYAKAKTEKEQEQIVQEWQIATDKTFKPAVLKPKASGGSRKAQTEAGTDGIDATVEIPSEELNKDRADGLSFDRVVWNKKTHSVSFQVECSVCKEKKYVDSLDATNINNINELKNHIEIAAQEHLKKQDPADDVKTSDAKKKKEDVEDVNETMAKSECPELDDDNSNIQEIVVCQRLELHNPDKDIDDILKTCKAKEEEQSKSKEKISAKQKVSCKKIVNNYFTNFVKPIIQAGLSTAPERNPGVRSAGQTAAAMILGGKVIPARFLTEEITRQIDQTARQADLSLVKQSYDVALNQCNNIAVSFGTSADNCTKAAAQSAAQYMTDTRFVTGIYGNSSLLANLSNGLRGQNPDQDFLTPYTSQYQSPMQLLNKMFAPGKSQNPTLAYSALQAYQTNSDADLVKINADGSITVGSVVITQPGTGTTVPLLGTRGGRNDLRWTPPTQVPGLLPTQNPVLNNGQTVQPRVQQQVAPAQPVGQRTAGGIGG